MGIDIAVCPSSNGGAFASHACILLLADLLGIQTHFDQQFPVASELEDTSMDTSATQQMLITPPVSPPDSMAALSSHSGSDDELQQHQHASSNLGTVEFATGFSSSTDVTSGLPSLNYFNPPMHTGMSSTTLPLPTRPLVGTHPHPEEGVVQSAMSKRRKKTAHNAIERKYRNSINDRIAEIKDALPAHVARDSKTKSKATILQKCLDYLRHLEKTNNVLRNENQMLKERLHKLEGGGPAQLDTQGPFSAAAEHGRAVMCVLFCGFFVFGGLASPPQVAVGGHHGGGRVLASVADGDEDTFTSWVGTLLPWLFRAAAAALCGIVMFARDRVTDPSGAEEHEQKCAMAMINGNVGKAKHHALKSLALLGQNVPNSEYDILLRCASSYTRQFLHRCVLGEVVDSFLAQRNAQSTKAHVIAANVNHMFHQLLSMEHDPSGPNLKCLAMVQSLNAAEAVKSEMDPVALIRIYVAAAMEVLLSLHFDVASVLAGHYLDQARALFHSCAEDSASLAWIFKPEGDEFFRSGRWCDQTLLGLSGEKLRPGLLDQLGMAYRSDLLARGLRGFIAGMDAERANDIFCDLRQYSIECGDTTNEWWAAIGVVLLSWRQGRNEFARQVFCEVDQMTATKTKLQQFVYVACRAHQALLDGDHALCWRAMRLAASLVARLDSEEDRDETNITKLGRLIAFQHLLATRVALIRVRNYFEQVSEESKIQTITNGGDGGDGGDGKQVSRVDMRNALHADVASLRLFSEDFALAKPAAHLYQAIYRSLAGGRASITEHMFHESLKSARRLKQPYDEASAMLHASIYMRPTLTASAIKNNLTKAVSIFQRLEAMDELCTARKLLHVLV